MEISVHSLINTRAKIANVSLKKGDFVPYSSRKASCKYTFDLSYYGTISEVGEDPENSTMHRNEIVTIAYDLQ